MHCDLWVWLIWVIKNWVNHMWASCVESWGSRLPSQWKLKVESLGRLPSQCEKSSCSSKIERRLEADNGFKKGRHFPPNSLLSSLFWSHSLFFSTRQLFIADWGWNSEQAQRESDFIYSFHFSSLHLSFWPCFFTYACFTFQLNFWFDFG